MVQGHARTTNTIVDIFERLYQYPSITLLSAIVPFCSATAVKAGPPHLPRPHRVERLFPSHTRSFFWRAHKPPPQTGKPAPPSSSDDESRANCAPHNGPDPGRPWRAENTVPRSSGSDSS